MTKDDLKSGMMVVYRNGDERYVLKEVGYLYDKYGLQQLSLNDFDNCLRATRDDKFDIMEVYQDEELIWKREKETEQQKEIKRIEEEMRRLADDLEKLKEVE